MLRISGAIHLIPPYAFMAWRGTTLPTIYSPSVPTDFVGVLLTTDQKKNARPLYTSLGCHVVLLNCVSNIKVIMCLDSFAPTAECYKKTMLILLNKQEGNLIYGVGVN